MPEETITISETEYRELLQASKTLDALYAGGVDNWEWFEEALSGLENDS